MGVSSWMNLTSIDSKRRKRLVFVDSHGQFWYPDHAISWYAVSKDMAPLSYTNHDKFSMEPGATVWERYLASFYWVAATMTSNG